MSTAWTLAAGLIALTHFSIIAFLIVGGPLAVRFRRLIRWHLLTIAGVSLVNLMNADCPLTTMEKWCLRRAGRVPYTSGFVDHYIVGPFHDGPLHGAAGLALLAVWTVPTVVAYFAVISRRPRRAEPTAGATT